MRRFVGVIIFCVLSVSALADDSTKITVGHSILNVPLPVGYERCDGILAKFDDMIDSFMPPTSRLISYYALPDPVAKLRAGELQDLTHYYNIQVLKSVETQNVSKVKFVSLRKQLRDELAANSEKITIFENSENAFGYEMMAGKENAKMVVCHLMTVVNGKLINLYRAIPLTSASDTQTAQKEVLVWGVTIRSANPVYVPKFPVMNRLILFSIVGLVAGFIFLKSKKSNA